MITLSPKARDLILSFESLNQPGKWPGGDSGITIGYGYDLAHVTVNEFRSDWAQHLALDSANRLAAKIGIHGEQARIASASLKDIVIKTDCAVEVFNRSMAPKYLALTEKTFPGIESLPLDAQGALVSLVFNRGGSLEGDRRVEMRTINALIRLYDIYVESDDYGKPPTTIVLSSIADNLRLMKRLWEGKGLDGLLRRRDAEADLVESCIGAGK